MNNKKVYFDPELFSESKGIGEYVKLMFPSVNTSDMKRFNYIRSYLFELTRSFHVEASPYFLGMTLYLLDNRRDLLESDIFNVKFIQSEGSYMSAEHRMEQYFKQITDSGAFRENSQCIWQFNFNTVELVHPQTYAKLYGLDKETTKLLDAYSEYFIEEASRQLAISILLNEYQTRTKNMGDSFIQSFKKEHIYLGEPSLGFSDFNVRIGLPLDTKKLSNDWASEGINKLFEKKEEVYKSASEPSLNNSFINRLYHKSMSMIRPQDELAFEYIQDKITED